MIRDKIIESGKVGLYKRLEYQVSIALCLCAGLWSVLSFILMLFASSGKYSWPVWVVLFCSAVTFCIILYRLFYTYTRSEQDIVNGVCYDITSKPIR